MKDKAQARCRRRRRSRAMAAIDRESKAQRHERRRAGLLDDGDVGRRFSEMTPFAAPDAMVELDSAAPDERMMSRLKLLPWIDHLDLHEEVKRWSYWKGADEAWRRLASAVAGATS